MNSQIVLTDSKCMISVITINILHHSNSHSADIITWVYLTRMSFENPMIKIMGIVYQNSHGSRYYSHYFDTKGHPQTDLSTEAARKNYEIGLVNKVQRMNIVGTLRPQQTSIFTYQSETVLFKVIDQLQIYLLVPEDENFVLMEQVINVIGEVLLMVTKGPYTGKIIFDYLQDIVLVTDEVIHEGYIANLDANRIYERIKMKDTGAESPKRQPKPVQNNHANGTFGSLFGYAKNTFNRTLNLG